MPRSRRTNNVWYQSSFQSRPVGFELRENSSNCSFEAGKAGPSSLRGIGLFAIAFQSRYFYRYFGKTFRIFRIARETLFQRIHKFDQRTDITYFASMYNLSCFHSSTSIVSYCDSESSIEKKKKKKRKKKRKTNVNDSEKKNKVRS